MPDPYLHVLVIEDDKDAKKFLSFSVAEESKAIEFTQAMTLEEGIRLLERKPDYFHVVLLDLGLPGYGRGGRAFDELRRHSDIPVVVMTGNLDVDLANSLRKRGVLQYLYKPIHGIQAYQACVNTYNYYAATEAARLMQATQSFERVFEEDRDQRRSEPPSGRSSKRADARDQLIIEMATQIAQLNKNDQRQDKNLRQHDLEITETRTEMTSVVTTIDKIAKLPFDKLMSLADNDAKVKLALIATIPSIVSAILAYLATR